MKRSLLSLSLLALLSCAKVEQTPKYVFYFIGDGMGLAHVNLTEAAISAKAGKIGFSPLSFSSFPHQALVTTYSSDNLITDSAAAGTALATGEKTSNGTIGMNADHTANLTSVATKAKGEGYSVGILSTVSLDHATPAAFYAHEPRRSMYSEIAQWLPKSGFDLFVGAGLKDITANFYDSISSAANYTIVRGGSDKLQGDRVVWIQDSSADVNKIPLAIDYKTGDMTLETMVSESINFLEAKSDKGFFMMIESGQIDWASHDNDAASIVHETQNLSQAVEQALEFYNKYPEQTLIIVTADHETGGLTLGRNNGGSQLTKLFDQGGSLSKVGKDSVMSINKAASAGFTSGNHTAVAVPLYAIGVGAEKFNGRIDNIDIPKTIEKLLHLNM